MFALGWADGGAAWVWWRQLRAWDDISPGGLPDPDFPAACDRG
ncbi:hypothetical protein L195_g030977 [Trifolium pratense]|uniref:Uncharacterized protein n=1 Tax=Trifolium pratense TaxID=57577 RepID=A0A2K3L935_TRIPR|nr:hypothetical protein L195_g030977 [Trifolium pratense]